MSGGDVPGRHHGVRELWHGRRAHERVESKEISTPALRARDFVPSCLLSPFPNQLTDCKDLHHGLRFHQRHSGAPNLCGIIQSTVSGIPNPFPQAFFQVDQTVDGDTGEYKVFSGSRTNATISPLRAPSKNRQLREIGVKAVKLLHSVENIVLPVKDYINLLNYNELAKQKMGIDEVSRQIREARWTQDNLRISSLTSMLFKTQIYYDGLGNLLPSSTGRKRRWTIRCRRGIRTSLMFSEREIRSSARRGQRPPPPIDKQIQSLHQAAVELTGYELKHAFYGKNVPSYLTSNTNLGNYFFRDSYGPEAFGPQFIATADIPNPLLGLTWHKAYQSFFMDQNGNRRRWSATIRLFSRLNLAPPGSDFWKERIRFRPRRGSSRRPSRRWRPAWKRAPACSPMAWPAPIRQRRRLFMGIRFCRC